MTDRGTQVAEIKELIQKEVNCLLQSYASKFGTFKPPILINNLVSILKNRIDAIKFENGPRGKLIKQSNGKRVIIIPSHFHRTRKRIEAAHEIAHLLFSNKKAFNDFISNSDKIFIEELIDYAARMILIPNNFLPDFNQFQNIESISHFLISKKKHYDVTAHTVIKRFFEDTDNLKDQLRIIEIIIWEASKNQTSGEIATTPGWKFSKGPNQFYIPIRSCFGKKGTSVDSATTKKFCVRMETVKIGNLEGKFMADSAGYWWNDGFFKRIITIFSENLPNKETLFKL